MRAGKAVGTEGWAEGNEFAIVNPNKADYLHDPKCAECRLRDLPAMACVFCEDHKAFQPKSAPDSLKDGDG